MTVVERVSKYTVLESVAHKTAAAVRQAVVQGLEPYNDQAHTITYDNGLEFSEHAGMAKSWRPRFLLPIRTRPGNGVSTKTRMACWVSFSRKPRIFEG